MPNAVGKTRDPNPLTIPPLAIYIRDTLRLNRRIGFLTFIVLATMKGFNTIRQNLHQLVSRIGTL